MVKKIIIFCISFFMLITAAGAQEKPQTSRIVSEQLLSEVDLSSLAEDSFVISSDSRRVAYIIKESAKQSVVVNGKRQKAYDSISMLNFDDGGKFHYMAKEGQKELFIQDGRTTALQDAKDHPDHREAPTIWQTSPDGKRRAGIITKDGKQIVVVDDKESEKSYDTVDGLKFSPDNQHIVYRAHVGNKFCMVVDGMEGKQYDFMGQPVLSQRGGRIAYTAHKKNASFIIVDGKEEKAPPNNVVDDLVFSPDGSRFAYSVNCFGGNAYAVLDEKLGKRYHSVDSLVFSPDSKHLAYTTNVVNTNKHCVVVDEKETGSYDMVWPPIFGMDTGRMVYKVRNGDKYHVVIDGKIGKGYDFIWVGTPVFTPDGNHVIYIARQANQIFMVVDENENERKYDGISSVGGRIIFDSADKFHYIARHQGAIYLVQESIS